MFVPTPSLPFPPVEYLRSGSSKFGSKVDIPTEVYARVRLDPDVGAEIADAYLAAPIREERAYSAYAAFCRETRDQFDFLIGRTEFGGLGVTVRFVDEDPYTEVGSMVHDLRFRRLKVWASAASGNAHPYLSDGQNDWFRAVHDAFGHAGSGRGFDRHGEEAAWVKHSTMYSPLARRALTTETRGQNCARIYRCGGDEFPEQKAALLPRRFTDLRPALAAQN
ncbi:hypothetical protein SAMN05421812_10960 [Asanoa hainanensis]|uniref:Uncharacterized protein n=1 Tax=Asanoa hainanensis TaxID=560556 RepID=A0A239NHR8_9ACTN|nr:hypothetical protein [Asanoa hainanensis]SNT54436.1 hypothetical protein SAMN05421812_10960 [Asanoa hainanensis]